LPRAGYQLGEALRYRGIEFVDLGRQSRPHISDLLLQASLLGLELRDTIDGFLQFSAYLVLGLLGNLICDRLDSRLDGCLNGRDLKETLDQALRQFLLISEAPDHSACSTEPLEFKQVISASKTSAIEQLDRTINRLFSECEIVSIRAVSSPQPAQHALQHYIIRSPVYLSNTGPTLSTRTENEVLSIET